MPATVELSLKPDTRTSSSNVEGAHAPGAVDLVARPAHQIDVVSLDVGRHLADPLRRVGVEHRAMLATDGTDRSDVVDGSDLVVRPHDRDEDGVVPHRGADQICGDDPV